MQEHSHGTKDLLKNSLPPPALAGRVPISSALVIVLSESAGTMETVLDL